MPTGLHFNGLMMAPSGYAVESGTKTFKLDIRGKTETIIVDRLKPAHLDLDSPVEVAQPRPRGRPKSSSGTQASSPQQGTHPRHQAIPKCAKSGSEDKQPR